MHLLREVCDSKILWINGLIPEFWLQESGPHLITQTPQKSTYTLTYSQLGTSSQLQGDRQEPPPVTRWLSNWLYGWFGTTGSEVKYMWAKISKVQFKMASSGPYLRSNVSRGHILLAFFRIHASHLLHLLIPNHLRLFPIIFFPIFYFLAHLSCPTVPGHIRTCSVLLFGGGCVFPAQPELWDHQEAWVSRSADCRTLHEAICEGRFSSICSQIIPYKISVQQRGL